MLVISATIFPDKTILPVLSITEYDSPTSFESAFTLITVWAGFG
jgi:hypothetical protein